MKSIVASSMTCSMIRIYSSRGRTPRIMSISLDSPKLRSVIAMI